MSKKKISAYVFIFALSFASSVVLLMLERLVGIGWEFHPDSVTYATTSSEMAAAILATDWWLIFNNGYYFVASGLNQSVFSITLMNMVVFSATNVILYKFHVSLNVPKKKYIYVALLLFNPYRLHLSTTMLKDTVIIALVILAAFGFKGYLRLLFVLLFFRIAAIIYGLMHLRGKYFYYISAVCLVLLVSLDSIFVDFILKFNESDMVLRKFDKIPTFQNFGEVGILLRAIVWPLLAVSGAFIFISPALEYFPVAIGSIFTQLYCYFMVGKFQLPLGLLLALIGFAVLVTGFTAYIRYIYPLLTVIPIIALKHRKI